MVLKAGIGGGVLEQKNHCPKKTITWIQGNFPRSWSQRDVPFRRCQKTCRRVNAGTQPHCEHTPWMSLSWEVGGWISQGIRQPTWLENGKFFRWKTFMSFPAAERITETIFRWKMETMVENVVDHENFPDTPIETLVMHPTNSEDAPNRAGQSQLCRVLETPNTLCNRSVSF